MLKELKNLYYRLNPDLLSDLKKYCIEGSSQTLESVITKYAAKHDHDKEILEEIKELEACNSISCMEDYYELIDNMIFDLDERYRVMVKMKFGIDDTFDAEYSGMVHESKEAANIELKEAERKLKDDDLVNYCYIEEI